MWARNARPYRSPRGGYMELRTLEYFMAIQREGNMLKAAKAIHLTQPTLSRQIKDLENELGITLIERSGRNTKLTEEGKLFSERVENILELVNKAKKEVLLNSDDIKGEINIGAAEDSSIKSFFYLLQKLQMDYNNIIFNISSGDQDDVYRDLDSGIIDFGIVFGNVDNRKYNSKKIITNTKWGVLFKEDKKYSKMKSISIKELSTLPLIVSRQISKYHLFDTKNCNIIATYNLLYNAKLMAEIGMGYVLCLNNIINTAGTNLCFIPLSSQTKFNLNIIWKKQTIYTKPVLKLIDYLNEK